MTDHPTITPPPELVQQWASESLATQNLCNRAAQWGADQELEATLAEVSFLNSRALADRVRAVRRPKPPTLTSIALQMLDTIERNARYPTEITDTIRRALVRLKQLEDSND